MYKSSERYKAGTDIIYDDGSKLQYPPFIYAITESGDNGGGDGGDDEEGEEFMIIKILADNSLDKTWGEISTALSEGKFPVIHLPYDEGGGEIYYIDRVSVIEGDYSVFAHSVQGETVYGLLFSADSDSSPLVMFQ